MKVAEGISVGEVKDLLVSKYPDFEKLLSLRLAVNESYVEDDHVVMEEDEVVIIPPVSGG